MQKQRESRETAEAPPHAAKGMVIHMLPTMKIGDREIARLIAGSNPFTGKSHLTERVNADMRGYYTEERVFDTLRRCEAAGINALQSRGCMPVMGLYGRYRAAGGNMLWLAQTSKELRTFDEELEGEIGEAIARECVAQGANFFAGVCMNLLRHPAWGRAQEAYGEYQKNQLFDGK